MRYPQVIGLCGRIGAGKTTLANHLRYKGASGVSFADPLKGMLHALGVPLANIYGTPEDKLQPLEILCGRSARYAAQTLGTEWGREIIGDDLWVNAWMIRARRTLEAKCFVVADDLRFPNEVAAVRSLGGIVIRVVRPDLPLDVATHASEQSDKLKVDYELINDGIDRLPEAWDRALELYNHRAAVAE